MRILNDSSYNLIKNCHCLHYCDVNTGNFFIFLLQFNTLHASHSNTNILHTSHSNTQNPVHYFGLIYFVLQTQTYTVLCITTCSYPRQKPKLSHTHTEQIENNIYNLTVSTRNIPLWLLTVRCVFVPEAFSQETWLTHSTWLFHSPSYRTA